MTFAEQIISFYTSLRIDTKLPKGIGILNPYVIEEQFSLCKMFYHKYYADVRQRSIIIGINPGRLGGGITGVPFTDPVKLEKICGIQNNLPKKTELSADFIYMMIDAYGGPEKFYGDHYFNSVSPLGFTYESKNINYYDDPNLLAALKPFIVSTLKHQRKFNVKPVAFCLGEGTNFRYLTKLNSELKLFEEIKPLPHPRFIMQYKRKSLKEYTERYLEILK